MSRMVIGQRLSAVWVCSQLSDDSNMKWLGNGHTKYTGHAPMAMWHYQCVVRNGVWYSVKYSSLKSFCVLQSPNASIPYHKMKFCGIVVRVRWQQIEQCIWCFACLSQVFIFYEKCKARGESWYLYVKKIHQSGIKFGFKVDWWFITTCIMTW